MGLWGRQDKNSEFIREEETKYHEGMATWREEYKKLCALADFDDDTKTDRQLRRRVFEIQDKAARLALVDHLSKLRGFELTDANLDLVRAYRQLDQAKASADNWATWPAVNILFWSGLSLGLERLNISPLIGVIAVAAIGVLEGLNVRDRRMRHMRDAVREAQAKLADARKSMDHVQNEEHLFSLSERRTGEPDPSS